MTDEAKFKVYFEQEVCSYCRDPQFCQGIDNCYDLATIKEHFFAGLKAGKPKWHKVADGDYPPCEKGNCTINVLTDCGDIAYYNYDDDCWVAEPTSAEIDPPIAWCERPTFNKE